MSETSQRAGTIHNGEETIQQFTTANSEAGEKQTPNIKIVKNSKH
jgi:hypothetical protein